MTSAVVTEERSGLGLAALPPSVGAVVDDVGAQAGAVDRGDADLWDGLRDLGEQGLLTAPLPLVVELAHSLARRCTATSFSLWGHRSAVEYHEATGVPLPAGADVGTVALASGMAPAFKEEAGLGEIPLELTDGADGSLSVTGVLPWCSNLRPGAWIVAPVRGAGDRRAIIRFARDADGVTVKPLTGLTALDGTSSGVVLLDDVRIPAGDVLTEDLPAFRDRVRAPFLLIQTGMCLGLAGAALDAAESAADEASWHVLAEEFRQATAGWATLRAELVRTVEQATAASAGDAERVPPRDLVSVRLESALLAGRATRLEQKVVGGRGYALGSDTSRRAREAAFLPVQSPTETHLRHLLAAEPELPTAPPDLSAAAPDLRAAEPGASGTGDPA